MSYYFAIIGTRDNPLFELDFGTNKVGGDGVARFSEEAKYKNQFIVHAALDVVEEVQWTNKEMRVLPQTSHSKSLADIKRQVSQTHRLVPKQSRTLLLDRRQCEIHASDEPGPNSNNILSLPYFATQQTFHCPPERDTTGHESE